MAFDTSALADLVPDSIIVTDAEGRVLQWNAGAGALYGFSVSEACGKRLDALLASRHPFGLDAIAAELVETGSWQGEVYRRAADGRAFCAQVRRVARRTAAGAAEIVEWSRDAGEVSPGEVAAHRYTNVFHAMAASFWELDFADVRKAIGDLVAGGEADPIGRLRTDRAFIDRAIDMVRVVDVNEKTLELFGIASREAALAGPMSWAWPEESRHVFTESLVAAMQRRDSFSTETVLARTDGSRIEVLFTVCWPADHKAQGTVLVGVTDITEQRRAFRELEASEHRYRDLFQHVPVALLQLDMKPLMARLEALGQGGVEDLADYVENTPEFLDEVLQLPRIEQANVEALRLFGVDSVDALKGPIAWGWHERPETIRRSLCARLRGEPRYSEETRVNRRDGSPIDVLYTMTFSEALTDRGINVVGFVDISDRAVADEALRKSERRYRDLFHHVPMALWQVDTSGLVQLLGDLRAQGVTDLSAHIDAHPEFLRACMDAATVQEVNAATVELFGAASAEEFAGHRVTEYWELSPDTFRRSIEARFAGAPGYAEETVLQAQNGERVEVVYSISFLPALQELGITLIGTVDVRDRKRAEARLRQVQAEFSHAARVSTLGELTASIAHEVNQPLAAISAFGQASLRWLQKPEPDLQEVMALTGDIVADARRASDIIARIRGMALKRDPDPQPLSVNALIEESLLIVRHEGLDKGVTVETVLGDALPPVMADRVQLQQVVVNLAMNAIQAMAGAGVRERVLTVTTRAHAGEVEMLVEDTGGGIEPGHLERLFSGFFTTKENGMGMGLPICRSIVQAHGGRIRAENSGNGARFTVALPTA
ncbi:MAG: PAS domain S-box protein [Sphingomonas sp.]|uniref:PAS domain-containing sensor histidine kinase n=1 Tax=Sphingomonas sp. TaxID=28214 RepID=UPI001B051056|nr:PAS domain S-box protein [Sphingomonas sp.]MBO9623363.1 PAS domain S-box protein [Sphingomonas sp.]